MLAARVAELETQLRCVQEGAEEKAIAARRRSDASNESKCFWCETMCNRSDYGGAGAKSRLYGFCPNADDEIVMPIFTPK